MIPSLILAVVLGQTAPRAPVAVTARASVAGTSSSVEIVADYPQMSRAALPPSPDGEVLDSRTVTEMVAGEWIVWALYGHVVIRATSLGGPNAVVSGVLFGPTVAPVQVYEGAPIMPVAFLRNDTVTSGTWRGVYGSGGAAIAGDAVTLPPGVTFSPATLTPFLWKDPSVDPRALQKGAGPERIMAGWYGTSFALDLTVTGQPREVAIYVTDYDSSRRQSKFDVAVPGGSSSSDSWNMSGWEIASVRNGLIVKSVASDTFPNIDAGYAHYRVPADLFPTVGVPYSLAIRYQWRSPNADPSMPSTVSYTAWTPAGGTVTIGSDGSFIVGTPVFRR